ncbi:MAG: DSBA-like thioredoxin domain-containing protein [Microgenomates group bacterium Gr01-1014_16]|nr:MAG: DSBA-like thioredoxin domain-containing protein [Microgenomates group bacterium Gr01-1014_16]
MDMAVRRTTHVEEMPMVAELPKKSMWDKLGPVLVVLLIVAAFAIGSLWTKTKYVGTGTAVAPVAEGNAVPSKYKNLAEAFKDYAKQIKIDGNKLVSCMNSGDKSSVVQADLTEGSGFGVQGTPAFFINGRLLAGAYPFEEFKKIIDEELSGNPKPTGTRAQVSLGSASTRGSGKVTLVEYSDFQCPFCSRALPTVQQIMKEYDGKVLFAYKHFPLSQIHPNAQKAAEAAECARDQGKFWEFHDKLFEDQNNWANVPQT